MAYRSNAAAAARAVTRGLEVGLVRAGAVVADAVREKLAPGYTTGNFVTGLNVNSVYVTGVARSGDTLSISVTTSLTDPPYPAFWEEGHQNRFTRRYERVPKWAPALAASQGEATTHVITAVEESLRAVGATFTGSVRASVRRGGRD